MIVILGEMDKEAARRADVADSNFEVLQLGRELQCWLQLPQLLFLSTGDFLVCGINCPCGQTKLKWRVPHHRLSARQTGILWLKSIERMQKCREQEEKKTG